MRDGGARVELSLHRLWIFMRVVECGGFSAAAHTLYMSQPSVSNQLRRLERSLGAPLVDRSGPRVRPTAEGEVLFEYGKRVFLLADEAVTALRQVGDLESGRLVVGGTTTVGTYLLPTLLARFRQQHPGIVCELYVANNVAICDRLLEGELGIGVIAGTTQAHQLSCTTVLDERLVLIAAPDHPLAGPTAPAEEAESTEGGAHAGWGNSGAAVLPEQLAEETFLLREPGSQTRQRQEAALEQWQLPDVTTGSVGAPEAIKQCVARGLGVSLISEHAVLDEVREGRLTTLRVEPTLPSRPISLVRRRDRLLAPAERAFLTLLDRVHDWPVAGSTVQV